MQTFIAQVDASFRQHALLPAGAGVLVAVSGGVDSMVLLRVLHTQTKGFVCHATTDDQGFVHLSQRTAAPGWAGTGARRWGTWLSGAAGSEDGGTWSMGGDGLLAAPVLLIPLFFDMVMFDGSDELTSC